MNRKKMLSFTGRGLRYLTDEQMDGQTHKKSLFLLNLKFQAFKHYTIDAFL